MKKISILVMVAVLFFGSPSLHAQDQKHMFTGSLLNGHYITEAPDTPADSFIQGVIDGIGKMAPGQLSKIYPGYNRGDVVQAVKAYYRDNPAEKNRPVADVLLSGCVNKG
ncbi:MAG: hypothetical protein ABID83_01235 [Candidatus Omnitrophota bacterium]